MSDNEAPATNPTLVRRRRGDMEELMRQICNKISMGDVPPPRGGNWTVSYIARAIHEEFPFSGVKPSLGAVADNLNRWHQMGYAIINPKPLSFVDFTEAGRDIGLAALKQRFAEAEKKRRGQVRAAKAASEAKSYNELVGLKVKESRESEIEEGISLVWEQQEFVFGDAEDFSPIAHAPANPTETLSITYTPSN
jgi:hypothetical protein